MTRAATQHYLNSRELKN